MSAAAPTVERNAAEAGLFNCGLCGLLNRVPAALDAAPAPPGTSPLQPSMQRSKQRRTQRPTQAPIQLACVRCGTALHARKPGSVTRTWALLIAAYVLYLPANLLPVLHTTSLAGTVSDTIMSGVLALWMEGAWLLASIILVASIGVPLGKLVALTWLLIVVRPPRHPLLRACLPFPGDPPALNRHRNARLYRLIDLVGRWSMVDIYVGALLVSLMRFHPVAVIEPGPGAIAFGAVVVLTMLASKSFDPRLLWDARTGTGGATQPPARREAREGREGRRHG
jgi:paraquat-inducible protein A